MSLLSVQRVANSMWTRLLGTAAVLTLNFAAGTAFAAQNLFPGFPDEHTVALWLFDEP